MIHSKTIFFLFLFSLSASAISHACHNFYKQTGSATLNYPFIHSKQSGTIVLTSMDHTVIEAHDHIIRALSENSDAKILVATLYPKYYNETYNQLIENKQMFVLDMSSVLKPNVYFNNWSRDFVGLPISGYSGGSTFLNMLYGNKDSGAHPVLGPRDQQLAFQSLLGDRFNVRFRTLPIYGEWGNASFDSEGRLFLTKSELIKNVPQKTRRTALRNKDIRLQKRLLSGPLETAQTRVEKFFHAELGPLGLKEIVWVEPLKESKEATGHIDMYVAILGYNHVVVSSSQNRSDQKRLDAIAQEFLSRNFRVDRLPILQLSSSPSIFFSYTNITIYKDIVLIPKYFHPFFNNKRSAKAADEQALQYYKSVGFKTVVQIPSHDTIQSGGSVHCLTSFIPFYLW